MRRKMYLVLFPCKPKVFKERYRLHKNKIKFKHLELNHLQMEGYFLECPLIFFILVINIRNKRLMGNPLFVKNNLKKLP